METDIPLADQIDKKIAAIAAKQRGYITRRQLLKLASAKRPSITASAPAG